jgi:hypothetical protein
MSNQENSFTRKCVTDDAMPESLSTVTIIPGRVCFIARAFDRVALSAVNAQVEPRIRAAACEASRNLLLAYQAGIARREGNVAAPGVDIQSTTACITGVDG